MYNRLSRIVSLISRFFGGFHVIRLRFLQNLPQIPFSGPPSKTNTQKIKHHVSWGMEDLVESHVRKYRTCDTPNARTTGINLWGKITGETLLLYPFIVLGFPDKGYGPPHSAPGNFLEMHLLRANRLTDTRKFITSYHKDESFGRA